MCYRSAIHMHMRENERVNVIYTARIANDVLQYCNKNKKERCGQHLAEAQA